MKTTWNQPPIPLDLFVCASAPQYMSPCGECLNNTSCVFRLEYLFTAM